MTIEHLDQNEAAKFVIATSQAIERIKKDIRFSPDKLVEPTLYFSYENENNSEKE